MTHLWWQSLWSQCLNINRDMYCSVELSRSPYLAKMTNGVFPPTSYQKHSSGLVPDHSPNVAIPPGTSL